MTELLVRDVSDTARWVAAYRARESARPDALFRDPFAAKLAGELGQRIADKLGRSGSLGNGWPIIARTKIIDDYVQRSVAEGCTSVLNLAAGLDTRPYRLDLPRELSWIEVDLPGIMQFKEEVLAGEQPACELRREAVDLADADARSRLFDAVAASAQKVLVVSEGLLVYLDPEHVVALSRDLSARPALTFWVTDVASPGIVARMNRGAKEEPAGPAVKFGPANGIAFFEELGWSVAERLSLFREGVRFKRVPFLLRPFAWLPDPDPRNPGDRPLSWVMRLERRA